MPLRSYANDKVYMNSTTNHAGQHTLENNNKNSPDSGHDDKNIQFRKRLSVRHSREIISIYWKISIFWGKFFFFRCTISRYTSIVYGALCMNHTTYRISFYNFNGTKTFNHHNAINSEKYLWYGNVIRKWKSFEHFLEISWSRILFF